MGGLLVSVNDEPVTGLDVATVFTILSSCEPPLDLRFRVTASSPAAQKALAKMQQRSGGVHSRINPAFDDLTRAVQFTFGASAGPLGIHMVDHVNGGVVIDGVGQGSIAEREGVVVGSMILGVNSEDVRELNVAPVLAICMSGVQSRFTSFRLQAPSWVCHRRRLRTRLHLQLRRARPRRARLRRPKPPSLSSARRSVKPSHWRERFDTSSRRSRSTACTSWHRTSRTRRSRSSRAPWTSAPSRRRRPR